MVQVSAADGVARVVLDRPDRHNALCERLIADLDAALSRLAGDPSLRLLVLAGAGPSFSAGADLDWMRRMAEAPEAESREDAAAVARMLRRLHAFPTATLALVDGSAFGGGVGLVAACDLAVASETATFRLSEVRLGLIPAVIAPYLVQAIGPRATRRYAVTAESFDAREAHRLGLVHEVVEHGHVEEAGERIAAGLAANGPLAMREVKALVARVGRTEVDDDLMRDTADRIARLRASDEGREGIAAFLERRRPAWDRGAGPA
jgi:methylglutaconyl-CoA hydratase